MKFFLYFCLVFNVSIYASEDDNITEEWIQPGYIDIYHGAFSAKIHEWGIGIDGMIVDMYEYFEDKNTTKIFEDNISTQTNDLNLSDQFIDNNASTVDLNPEDILIEDMNESLSSDEDEGEDLSYRLKKKGEHLEEGLGMDEFFLTRKLLEQRDKSYVRVSFSEQVNSLEKEEFTAKVKARLSLGRSRKKLRLFIEDFNQDTAKNIGQSGEDEAPAIGVERSSGKIFGIKPRYSIGVHGFDLFARARYSYETTFGRWRLEPVQTFTYSIKDEFSELTELYLDTPTSDSTLLRFLVDRGTQSGVDGMHYDGFIQWFYRHRRYAGLSFNLGFNAHTNYENTLVDSIPPVIQEENRTFNYLFIMRWRENIWRKWLFYEIGPGVNYHEKHDYRPNYNIYFGLDFFFGHV